MVKKLVIVIMGIALLTMAVSCGGGGSEGGSSVKKGTIKITGDKS